MVARIKQIVIIIITTLLSDQRVLFTRLMVAAAVYNICIIRVHGISAIPLNTKTIETL